MARKLVTYTWTVVPTTIEDRYIFTVTTEYETRVSTLSLFLPLIAQCIRPYRNNDLFLSWISNRFQLQ